MTKCGEPLLRFARQAENDAQCKHFNDRMNLDKIVESLDLTTEMGSQIPGGMQTIAQVCDSGAFILPPGPGPMGRRLLQGNLFRFAGDSSIPARADSRRLSL